MQLSDGWPDFAHTLGQEMVFAQVAMLSRYWAHENRSTLPVEAVHLSQAAVAQDPVSSWQKFRRTLFGRWSARELCLLYARALPLVDGPPSIAEPALRGMGDLPLVWRLGYFPVPDRDDNWVSLFRRVRSLETEIALLRAGLAAWEFHDRAGSGLRHSSRSPVTREPGRTRALGDSSMPGRVSPFCSNSSD